MIEITTHEQMDRLIREENLLIIFKHSIYCNLSAAVFEEYRVFVEAHPRVTCAFIKIQNHRDLSDALEEQTGIIHQSPQAIVFKEGKPIWDASHKAITRETLQEAL